MVVVAKTRSVRTEADLRAFGKNVTNARKLHGLTTTLLAERAGISRPTLRSIERGDGSPRLENVMAVLRVLNLSSDVLTATDPQLTALGRLHADQALPQRVRAPQARP